RVHAGPSHAATSARVRPRTPGALTARTALRIFPRMRKPILLLALLCPAGAPGLAAQGTYYARLGAIGASNLLRDGIVDEVTVQQSIAPMLGLGGAVPLGDRGYRVGLEGTFASGKFHSREGGTDTDLGTVRTGTVMLELDGPLYKNFRWLAGLGGIKYWPSE